MNKENSVQSNKQGVMMFSPPKASMSNARAEMKEIPTVLCAKFQKQLVVNFDKVGANTTNIKHFKLCNPLNEKAIVISVHKVPEDKGITFSFGDSLKSASVTIPPKTTVRAALHWMPNSDIVLKDSALLKVDDDFTLPFSLQGSAGLGDVSDFIYLISVYLL